MQPLTAAQRCAAIIEYAINPAIALEYPIQDLDEEIRAILAD